jgi:hypothetical protein
LQNSIDKNHKMKKLSYIICIIASVMTVFIGLYSMDQFAWAAVTFLIWAISPYLLILFLVSRTKRSSMMKTFFILLLILAIGGVGILINVMFINPDPQSALAFIALPFYQLFIFMMIALPVYFMQKSDE